MALSRADVSCSKGGENVSSGIEEIFVGETKEALLLISMLPSSSGMSGEGDPFR